MAYFKSARFLALLFLTVTLIIGCTAAIIVTKMNTQWAKFQDDFVFAEDRHETDAIQVSDETGASLGAAWIVRTHEERIGVFDINGKLEYMVDVYVITLPMSDQKLLNQGIYVSGQEQLTALMEDYTG